MSRRSSWNRNPAVTYRPLVALSSLALLTLAGCGAADSSSQRPVAVETVTVTAEAEPAPTVTVTVTADPHDDVEAQDVSAESADSAGGARSSVQSDETSGQRNARKSAESYLEYSAFSREGLIEQLEYEEFSRAAAEYEVDAVNADWNEQAVKSAESYLE